MTCQLWSQCKIVAVRQAVICQLHREIGKHVNHKHDLLNFHECNFQDFVAFLDIFARFLISLTKEIVWQSEPSSSSGAWKLRSMPRPLLIASLMMYSISHSTIISLGRNSTKSIPIWPWSLPWKTIHSKYVNCVTKERTFNPIKTLLIWWKLQKQTRGTQHYNLVLQWSAETGTWRFERRKSDTEFMQQLGRAVMAYKYKPVYR